MHRSLPTFVDAPERVAERHSAPPPFFIFLHKSLCPPRSQCARWHASLQYLVLHLEHCFARRSSGAAQAAQFVRIILRFA